MRTLVIALLVAGTAAPAAADGPFDLPAEHRWGDAPDPERAAASERFGHELRVQLSLAGAPLADAYLHTAVYCDGHGLQQLRTATTRYHRGDVLRRFRRILAALEDAFGPASHGRIEAGVAYWGEDTALETWPVSKAKFMVVLIRNGPAIGECRGDRVS